MKRKAGLERLRRGGALSLRRIAPSAASAHAPTWPATPSVTVSNSPANAVSVATRAPSIPARRGTATGGIAPVA